MSISASPSTIICARQWPTPPAAVMPKEKPSANQKFSTPGAGPTSGLPSGVYEIGPL